MRPGEITPPIFGVPVTKFEAGKSLIKEGIFVYECPLCKKRFRYDDPYEPICTGPSENRDDHSPEVMRRVNLDTPKICKSPQ